MRQRDLGCCTFCNLASSPHCWPCAFVLKAGLLSRSSVPESHGNLPHFSVVCFYQPHSQGLKPSGHCAFLISASSLPLGAHSEALFLLVLVPAVRKSLFWTLISAKGSCVLPVLQARIVGSSFTPFTHSHLLLSLQQILGSTLNAYSVLGMCPSWYSAYRGR